MTRIIEVVRRGRQGRPGAVNTVAKYEALAVDTTLLNADYGSAYRATAAITITLPAAVDSAWTAIIDADGGAVTLSAVGNINGSAADLIITQGYAAFVYSDGTNFFVRYYFKIANAENLPSARNLIINGSGRINQRGYTSGTATTAANQFTLDRWFVVVSGESLTFTGTDAGRVMTAPAGGVAQVIEGANIVGGTYVLNWEGTATATVGGTARTKGETFTLTANTNATVAFTGGTFSDVQLERGSVVTPFEFCSIGHELLLCQRYYQRFSLRSRWTAAAGSNTDGRQFPLIVSMRNTPSTAAELPTENVNVLSFNATGTSQNTVAFEVVAASSGAVAYAAVFLLSAEATA